MRTREARPQVPFPQPGPEQTFEASWSSLVCRCVGRIDRPRSPSRRPYLAAPVPGGIEEEDVTKEQNTIRVPSASQLDVDLDIDGDHPPNARWVCGIIVYPGVLRHPG